MQRVRSLLLDRPALSRLVEADATSLAALLRIAATTAAKLDVHHGCTTTIGTLVNRVQVQAEQIVIEVDTAALRRILGLGPPADDAPLIGTAPAIRIRRGKDVKLVLTRDDVTATERDQALVSLIAEAHIVRDAVLAAPNLSRRAIAAQLGKCSTRAARLMRIAWLAPEIVEAISEGQHPPRLTPAKLLTAELPVCWAAQRKMLGMA